MPSHKITFAFLSSISLVFNGAASSAQTAHSPWSGFYAGGNVGHAWADLATTDSTLETDGTVFGVTPGAVNQYRGEDSRTGLDGWFGGGQIGLNLSSGNVVVGLEADIQSGDNSARSQFLGSELGPTYRTSASLDLFGTARMRVGYVIGNALFYGTAGVAFGKGSGTLSISPGTPDAPGVGGPYVGKDSQTHTGYAVGGGLEYRLTRTFSIKAEYLHVDLSRETYTFSLAGSNGSVVTADEDLTLDIGRIGLNVHF